jgi:hypothetical protein
MGINIKSNVRESRNSEGISSVIGGVLSSVVDD